MKKKKFRNPLQSTILSLQSTANHHRKTHKPTITAKPTQSKSRTNQNKQIKTHKSSQSWATPVLVHEHVGERDGGTRTSTLVLGDWEHEHKHIGFRWVQIWGGFDRRAALIWGGFSSPTAPPSTTSSPTSLTASSGLDLGRQRERELRKRVERESRTRVLGK